MQNNLMSVDDPLPLDLIVERRAKPRIYEPILATVRGKDAKGDSFEADTVLDNLSANGLYFRFKHEIGPGTKLFFVIRLSASQGNIRAPRIAVRGVVMRTEPILDGSFGLAVAFTHHRFL